MDSSLYLPFYAILKFKASLLFIGTWLEFMFKVDERIESSCVLLHHDVLSDVYLKNAREYPWLILVPRVVGVRDLDELNDEVQLQLLNELNFWSLSLKEIYQPDKINVGALGNVVSMLHVHIIARFHQDPLWPQGLWQAALETHPYEERELLTVLEAFASYKNQR